MAKNKDMPMLKCKRCGHVWIPRNGLDPVRCARCRSPYWAIAKANGKRKTK